MFVALGWIQIEQSRFVLRRAQFYVGIARGVRAFANVAANSDMLQIMFIARFRRLDIDNGVRVGNVVIDLPISDAPIF